MSGSQPLILTTLGSAAVVGLVLALLHNVPAAVARRLGRAEAQVGGLRWVFTLALVPMMLVAGLLLDKWGPQDVLVLGSLGLALGLASLGLSRHYRSVLGAAAVLGGGFALVQTTATVLMVAAFFPERPATSTNLGYVVVGLCAVLFAGLSGLLHRKLGLRSSLLLLGLLALLPAFVAILSPAAAFPQPVGMSDYHAVLRDARIWWAGFLLFLYLPLEQSVRTWAPAYLTEVGCRAGQISLILTLWGLVFAAARVGAALVPPGGEAALLLAVVIAAAITLGNLIGVTQARNGTVGLWLLAACLGPVLPTLVGGILGAFPERPGTALGALFALGGCGNLFLRPMVETYARTQPVRPTMRALLLLPLILAAPTLVLCLLL